MKRIAMLIAGFCIGVVVSATAASVVNTIRISCKNDGTMDVKPGL